MLKARECITFDRHVCICKWQINVPVDPREVTIVNTGASKSIKEKLRYAWLRNTVRWLLNLLYNRGK